jgi:hypothetical protein
MLIMLRNYPLAFYHAGRLWLKAFAKLDRAGGIRSAAQAVGDLRE